MPSYATSSNANADNRNAVNQWSGSNFGLIYKQSGSQFSVSASELLEYNPWWKDENAIKADPEIQSWSKREDNVKGEYKVLIDENKGL